MAEANFTPSTFCLLRVEDIAVHLNQSQLLPRVMTNLVWGIRFLTKSEMKDAGEGTLREAVNSRAIGLVEADEAWEAVAKKPK